MRIVQIIDTLDLLGGAQKMQVAFAEAVQGMNLSLTVITLEDGSQGTALPNKLAALGADVHFFPAPRLWSVSRLGKLIRFLQNGRFDVAHTNLTYANIVGVLAARLAKIPTVAGIRNAFNQPRRFHQIRAALETFTLNFLVQRIMAVGQATAQAHQRRVPYKPIVAIPNSVVIPKPVDPAVRLEVRAALLDHPERPLLITVGRLTKQKGYSDLLQAFALLLNSHPDARLGIVGDGELYAALQQEMKDLNLADKAFLLGRREDVPDLLAASDIFVSSSHWEGLSNAILEAMAAGLPIVATAVADTPNVVLPGTGLLVPPKQPHTLAQALITLLDDPVSRKTMGLQAKKHVAEHHNPTAWAEQLLDLYRSVMPQTPKENASNLAVGRSRR